MIGKIFGSWKATKFEDIAKATLKHFFSENLEEALLHIGPFMEARLLKSGEDHIDVGRSMLLLACLTMVKGTNETALQMCNSAAKSIKNSEHATQVERDALDYLTIELENFVNIPNYKPHHPVLDFQTPIGKWLLLFK